MNSGNGRLRRSVSFVMLVGVLGLSAVGLSQCRLVDNSVTGVDLKGNSAFGGGTVDCKKSCNQEFKDCMRAEADIHKAMLKDCNQLPSAERKACKAAESLRYKAAKHECSERKQACKEACRYREGSGVGGH